MLVVVMPCKRRRKIAGIPPLLWLITLCIAANAASEHGASCPHTSNHCRVSAVSPIMNRFTGENATFLFNVTSSCSVQHMECVVSPSNYSSQLIGSVFMTKTNHHIRTCTVLANEANLSIWVKVFPGISGCSVYNSEKSKLNIKRSPGPVIYMRYSIVGDNAKLKWRSSYMFIEGFNVSIIKNGELKSTMTLTKRSYKVPLSMVPFTVSVEAYNKAGVSKPVTMVIPDISRKFKGSDPEIYMAGNHSLLQFNLDVPNTTILQNGAFLRATSSCTMEGFNEEQIISLSNLSSTVVLDELFLEQNRRNCVVDIIVHVHRQHIRTQFNFSTFDVQRATVTSTDDGQTKAECYFAHNSLARGCCFKEENSEELIIIKRVGLSPTASKLINKAIDGKCVVVYDLEANSSLCNVAKPAVITNIPLAKPTSVTNIPFETTTAQPNSSTVIWSSFGVIVPLLLVGIAVAILVSVCTYIKRKTYRPKSPNTTIITCADGPQDTSKTDITM